MRLDNSAFLPSVSEQPLPMVRLDAPESGNGAEQTIRGGKALEGAAVAAMQIEDMRVNGLVAEKDNDLTSSLQDMAQEYNTLSPSAAVASRQAYIERAQRKITELTAQAGSGPEQTRMQGLFKARMQDFAGKIGTSYVANIKKHEANQDEASIMIASRGLRDTFPGYIAKGSDDSSFKQAREEVDAAIEIAAVHKGYQGKEFEAFKMQQLSGMHQNFAMTLLAKDQPKRAKEYLEQHADEMDLKDYQHLVAMTKKTSGESLGIQAAMEAKAAFLKGEKESDITQRYFKKFGGNSDEFDSNAFKTFEAQFRADILDTEREWHQDARKLAAPAVVKQSEVEEKLGRQMSPKELYAIPEFQALRKAGENNRYAAEEAERLENKVTQTWRQEQRDRKMLNAASAAEAKRARADQLDATATMTLADYSRNPKKLAQLDDMQKAAIRVSLPKDRRDDWDRLIKVTTSPDAIGKLELHQQDFDNKFKAMGLKDKAETAKLTFEATQYLLKNQKDQGFHYSKEAADQALTAAVAKVKVKAVGGYNPFSDSMEVRYMDVKHKGNIIFTKEDKADIASVLQDLGINSAHATNAQIDEAFATVLARRGPQKK